MTALYTVTLTQGRARRSFTGSYSQCRALMDRHAQKMQKTRLRLKYGTIPSNPFMVGDYPEPAFTYGAVITNAQGKPVSSISRT